jgi:outer membrane protein OmpA-like peptidoglycan-associated protein
MKFAAVSALALAIFMGPALAQDATDAAAQDKALEQQPATDQPVVEVAPVALPDGVLALINDRRASQELNDDALKQRAKQVRRAMKADGISDDIKVQLQAMFDADRAELETRVAAQKPIEQPVQEAAPTPDVQPVQEAAPQPEPQPQPEIAAEQVAPAVAEIPAEITALLNDGRPAEELDSEQLSARAKFARQESRNEALPEEVRNQLTVISKQARSVIMARKKAEETKKVEEAAPQPEAQPVQEATPQVEPAPVVVQPVETQAVEPVQKAAPPIVVDKADVKELDGNVGDPVAEDKARAFLNDDKAAQNLNDDELRARLDGMRDLMAENELSVKTERALRDKLRAERPVLRERMARANAAEELKTAMAQAAEPAPKVEGEANIQPVEKKRFRPNINIIITAETPVRQILRDRREPEVMDESELRYRIRARRDFEATPQFTEFDQEQQQVWRDGTRSDRQFLRRRLEEDRNIRRVELEKPTRFQRIVIADNRDFSENDIPEDVVAAEVSDSDIERALLAAPRRKIIRKVRAEEIVSNPQLRKALTRIDIDTIRFGFNEAFVREEEVDNLDQIASVIERVLTKYPREVFLIEGHTDAVGSDSYNDKLSKARAEAVKKTLTTYYIIPAKNLQTVGLGERYLKIPTADAEQENRRVSISRATAVVGETEE